MIGEQGHKWVALNAGPSKHTLMATLTLDEEGRVKGTLQTQDDGYVALRKRQAIVGAENEENYFKNYWQSQIDGLKVSKYSVNNLKNIAKPLTAALDIEMEAFQETEVIYFSPFIERFFKQNPFLQENRKYPVDFPYPITESYIFTLTISANYHYLRAPPLPPSTNRPSFPTPSGNQAIQFNCVAITRWIK